jgi:hypothetical protein
VKVSKALMLILFFSLLLTGLWFTPMKTGFAQEDPTGQVDVAEEDEISVAGPGAVIIMVGLAAILIVGATYSVRRGGSKPEQSVK